MKKKNTDLVKMKNLIIINTLLKRKHKKRILKHSLIRKIQATDRHSLQSLQ